MGEARRIQCSNNPQACFFVLTHFVAGVTASKR